MKEDTSLFGTSSEDAEKGKPMNKRILLVLLSIALLTSLVITGCGAQETTKTTVPEPTDGKETTTEAPAESTDKPAKDLELVVYASSQEEMAAIVCDTFEKATGIKTTFTRLSGGEALTRIKEEQNNPQADIWYGGTTDPYNEAKALGLLEHFVPENAKNMRADVYKDTDGYWYGVYTGNVGFLCNQLLLDEKNLPVPQDWEDLLDPMYKDCIAFANPGTAGTGRQILNTLGQMWGDEKAMEYFAELDKNVRHYPKTGSGPGKMVGIGELEIAIGFLADGVEQILMGYDDVVMVAPKSGTSFEVGATAIIKDCKNMEDAQIILNRALTPEAQAIGETIRICELTTVKDAKDPEVMMELCPMYVKLMDYDFA
ncbi:MAG: ABC transporter substrate-binding protein, partial [Armatimonadetes bacterium]|nr:ABC transporter substrate-binding protein [Armatimonadota bacterium]